MNGTARGIKTGARLGGEPSRPRKNGTCFRPVDGSKTAPSLTIHEQMLDERYYRDSEEPFQDHLGLQCILTAYQQGLEWGDAPRCPVA